MTADPQQPGQDQDDATNQGVSSTDPVEGTDEAPAGAIDSPIDVGVADAGAGVTIGETSDER